MSREIKFRGKTVDKYCNEWVYGLLARSKDSFNNKITHCILNDEFEIPGWGEGLSSSCYNCVNPATIGQFTGLQDRNGVDIYEHDIIRTNSGIISPVEWDESGGWTINYYEKDFGHITDWVPRPCKNPNLWCDVIGNVWENPGLLGVNDGQG